MRYDLKDPFQLVQAEHRFRHLSEKGATIEMTEKKARTLSQNNYLHLILGWFGLQVGETLDYVKMVYYKHHCNRDLFEVKQMDRILGVETVRLRSSAELTTEQMTLSIERFRHWAAKATGKYLPSPDEREFILQMETEVERGRVWI